MSKKSFLVSIPIILIIATGGYTAYWFMAASKIKSEVIAQIEKLHCPVSYESVSTGGFPLRVEVRLNKVHVGAAAFQIDCDELALSRSIFGSEWKIGGIQTLSVSAPARPEHQAFKLIATIPDRVWVTWTQFDKSSDIPQSAEEWKAFLHNMKTVDYKTGKATLVEANSGHILLDTKGGDFNIKVSSPDSDRRSIEATLSEKDFEYKPEFNEFIKSITGKNLAFAVVGKQSFDGKVSASWPTSSKGPIHIDLTRLDYHSSYGNSHTQLSLKLDTDQGSGSLKLSGNWAGGANITGSMRQAMKDYFASAVKDGADSPRVALFSSAADTLCDLVQAEGKVDFDASATLAHGTLAPSINLKTSEYKSGPYDISIKGEYLSNEPKKAFIHVKLTNFKLLLDKFAANFSPDLKDKLTEIFDSISPASRGSNNLDITYSMDTGKIGALTPQEFLDKCTALVGSVKQP